MTTQGQRLALIVASNQYTDRTFQQLVAPGHDAADLARVLEDPTIGNFEVKRLINRPDAEVRHEIEVFFKRCKRDDLLLLYFSCHGIKDDDGRLYFVTTNTEHGLYLSTAVPAIFVNDAMNASRSRWQVLILDCCYGGAFARGMVTKAGESVDIRDRFEGRGRIVLTASNAIQYAFQGDGVIGKGSRSVFTHCLVQGIETGEADRNRDGRISVDELYGYVYARMADKAYQQTPCKWAFDLQGDILIAHSPLGKRKPVAEDASLAAQYAEGIGALDDGRWQEALVCFEDLEDKRPGYRDAADWTAWLRRLIATKEEDASFTSLLNSHLVESYLREAALAGLDMGQLPHSNLGAMLERIVQQITEQDRHRLSREHRKTPSTRVFCRLLSYLGWYMCYEGITSCDETSGIAVIEEILTAMQMDQHNARQVLDWLATTYWLRKTGSGTLEFRDSYIVHVFAAMELKEWVSQTPGSAILGLGLASNPARWQKAVVFLAGMLTQYQAIGLLEDLLEAGLIQLAGWCIAEEQPMPQSIVARVTRALLKQLALAQMREITSKRVIHALLAQLAEVEQQ